MKLPYIKIYTADLLAAGRNLTAQQLGEAILGVCEQAFENDTAYLPSTAREERFFDMLTQWKNESATGYNQKKKKGKKAASARWGKTVVLDGATSIRAGHSQPNCQTDTETKTETETETKTEAETKNISLTAPAKAAQGEREFLPKKAPLPAEFVDQVIARFEQVVKTSEQKDVFVRRNARCLKDILNFCDHNIPLALQTISVCARRLEKGGMSGGYEAVCRNLPEYYEKAQQELREGL